MFQNERGDWKSSFTYLVQTYEKWKKVLCRVVLLGPGSSSPELYQTSDVRLCTCLCPLYHFPSALSLQNRIVPPSHYEQKQTTSMSLSLSLSLSPSIFACLLDQRVAYPGRVSQAAGLSQQCPPVVPPLRSMGQVQETGTLKPTTDGEVKITRWRWLSQLATLLRFPDRDYAVGKEKCRLRPSDVDPTLHMKYLSYWASTVMRQRCSFPKLCIRVRASLI